MRSNTRIRAGSPTSQGCAPTIARSSHRSSLVRARADLFPMLDMGHKSEIRGYGDSLTCHRKSEAAATGRLSLRRQDRDRLDLQQIGRIGETGYLQQRRGRQRAFLEIERAHVAEFRGV